MDALEREIRSADPRRADRAADTIFFGGGTPSLLDAKEVARLIAACRETFDLTADAEITLETNPETATPDRLDAFRAAGVNRISFGVQSFDDAELARLGRIHSSARAREAVRTARAAGFTNLSFDLMLWLPGQSLASWLRTIDEAIALAPDHLSLYLLELYPNAPLKESMARAQPGWAQAHGRRCGRHVSGGARAPRRGRPGAVRDLQRRAARLSEPPQRQVLAGGLVVRIRLRRAFHGGWRPVEEPRLHHGLRRSHRVGCDRSSWIDRSCRPPNA